MLEVVVLGAGMQGRAAVYDLCRQKNIDRVSVIDADPTTLDAFGEGLEHDKIVPHCNSLEKI
ncbi:MAG: hypothetical protein OEZ59_11885, partial [Deltaproteobacteria bacterium]|nr:hypothetical protein [Deltaproteobacteria bacterium]